MTTLRAHFDGKVLIPIGPVDLPTDRELEIHVEELPVDPSGSPEAIAQVLERLPILSDEDVDAFERAVEEAKLPVREGRVFDENGEDEPHR
jgi:hypothetical protein